MAGRTPGLNRVGLRRLFAPAAGGGAGPAPGFPDTLAGLYAFGLVDDPVVDNRLLGSYYDFYFDTDGTIKSERDVDELVVDLLLHPPITTNRFPHDGGFSALHRETRTRYPASNVTGGSLERYTLINDTTDLEANILDYYVDSAQAGDGTRVVKALWRMIGANAGNSELFRTSDGYIYNDVLLYDTPALKRYFQLSIQPRNGSDYADGSQISILVTGPGSPEISPEMVSLRAVVDDHVTAFGQIEGHWDVYASTLAGGPELSASFYPDRVRVAGNLIVVGDAAMGDIAMGNLDVNGILDVLDDANVGGTLIAGAGAGITGNVNIFGGDLAVDGSGSYAGSFSVDGAVVAYAGSALPAMFETPELDLVAAAGTTVTFNMPTPPAGKAWMLVQNRTIVTARDGTVTTGPTVKIGNNGAHDNMFASVGPIAGLTTTVKNAWFQVFATPLLPMPDASAGPLVMEIITPATLGTATVFRAKTYFLMELVDLAP